MKRPLTPSFVGDAIAPAANNRYSVPYESSYPSQKGQIWAKMGSDLLFFCILTEKDTVLNVQCWELGSKLGSFWEVKSHV